MLTPWKESYDRPRQHIQKRCYFINKGSSSQGYGFSSSHVWMWELDYKESWVLKNWCFWTLVLEKTLESPLDCKEIQPVHPKGDQSWVFIGRTDVEAATPILWPPDAKSWLIWKDPDAGKDGGQEEKGMTEDEMVGWHHRLNGHGFGWTPGVGDGQGGLACCGSWGHKKLDTTERLNWTSLIVDNNNKKTFLDQIVTCDEKWILYNNHWWLAQLLDWAEAPKHFPKSNLHQKRSWSLFGGLIHYCFLNAGETIISEKYAQQIDEMHSKSQQLQPGIG